ncbi:alpha/beta-hydrolase [Melanomma pulvis-pyrius CBS 109.77]|uniref:Alpha/beta-hydrolase n=1 Tax=Melanomma pulvis-pyrius CBS 109.77 TaxID=1314802 RepID=A0A6A6X5S0_9PLEO|nr:alpha/beta-hydrolase [Melanomma pulvis-pyrius CBS 109.77]
MPSASAILKPLFGTLAGIVGLYIVFISLLTIPTLQDHVIYLHRVTLTWFQDVNVPEQWGFLRNQVTPFHLSTPDGETLHAWHILPLETYREHQKDLRNEPTGLCSDITKSLSFKLLKDDPSAQLVIYLHGAAGTLGSGWRPQSYRAISAAAPNIHILAIDYRGFGTSTGWPSETGLLTDALTLTKFAIETAKIQPERTVIFAQSLGTGVAISLSHHLTFQSPPTLFAGMVLIAPFANIELLTKTYRVAGTIPLLSPVAFFPKLLETLNRFIISKWPSKDKIAAMIRHLDNLKLADRQTKYDISIIHAEDDYDIPWIHSDVLFWNAVNATRDPESSFTFDELEREKDSRKTPLGAGGWELEWMGKGGVIREEIVKHGLHDRIMSYPVVSLAIARAFHSQDRNKLDL